MRPETAMPASAPPVVIKKSRRDSSNALVLSLLSINDVSSSLLKSLLERDPHWPIACYFRRYVSRPATSGRQPSGGVTSPHLYPRPTIESQVAWQGLKINTLVLTLRGAVPAPSQRPFACDAT